MRTVPHLDNPVPAPTSRLLQLDFLRGVAILLVLVNHQIPEAIPESGPIRVIATFGTTIGWLGVDLFFVISGFLIGSLLFNELKFKNRIDVRRFLVRRGLRIWPAYYVFVACVALSEWVHPTWYVLRDGPVNGSYMWPLLRGLAINVLNIQNYFLSLRAHTWSLAVEEHFYLILPFLLLGLTRSWRRAGDRSKPIAALPWVTLGLFLGCSGTRIYNALTHLHPVYFATHFRIDELFFGVLLAYFNCLRPGFTAAVNRHRAALIAVGLAAFAGLVWCASHEFRLKFPCIAPLALLSFGSFLLVMLTTPLNQGWIGKGLTTWPARVVAFIGVYSYSIYLWHPDLGVRPIEFLYRKGFFGAHATNLTWLLVMVVMIAAEVIIGVVTSRMVEEPVLAFRDRFFPRQTSVITADEAAAAPAPRLTSQPAQADEIGDPRPGVVAADPGHDPRRATRAEAMIPGRSPDPIG